MRITTAILFGVLASACGSAPQNNANKPTPTPVTSPSSNASQPTPVPTNINPKNGDYTGRGKVTKINNEIGSVELDHEDIPGLMPKMIMEFYVTDKALLKNIAVGDNAEFVIQYKQGIEKIISIKKLP